jgi:hypothetical protein
MEDDVPASPTPPPPTLPLSPDRARNRARKRVLVEFFVVTAGVPIALLLEGLLEWNHYRALVQEARQTLTRTI